MQPLPSSDQIARLFSLQQNVRPTEFVMEADVCTLGRYSGCDIVVEHEKIVSRLHARIKRKGPRYFLHDDDSANGTFVNGKKICGPHLLRHDDVIGLGTPEAMLRFSDPDPTDLVRGRLHYDEQAMMFFWDQRQIDLTPNEFRLFHHLYQHAGEVCTRESCAKAVWRREFDPGPDDENLDRTISNIRSKLRRLDPTINPTDIINTRRGLGYELIP